MKLVKLTMLAAIAAIAAMAFIGASTASAEPPIIAICKKAELLNCKKENLVKHPLEGRIVALVGKGKFQAGFVSIECEKGEGHSNLVKSQQEKVFTATLEKLAFTTCTGCKKVAVTTPQVVTLDMKTETEVGPWELHAKGAKVQFTECVLSQSCTYEGNLDLVVQMNATDAFVEPKGASFTKVEPSTGGCAATGKWETGTALFDWELDDGLLEKGTRHVGITPSLLPKLIEVLL